MALKVEDPLSYELIDFKANEWENIPSIITKMGLTHEKYLSSTINYLAEKK